MSEETMAAEATIAGETIRVNPGEPVLMAMLRNGLGWSSAAASENSRGPFCNMGVCQECIVNIAGKGRVRACLTPIDGGDTVDF